MVAVALVGLGVLAWEPVYWWVMTEEVYSEARKVIDGRVEHGLRCYDTQLKWGPHRFENHGWSREYYVDSGLLASERYWEYAELLWGTEWRPDGTVSFQWRKTKDETKYSPPWWWGVTVQTEPSIPELMRDDDKWAKALEASKFKW